LSAAVSRVARRNILFLASRSSRMKKATSGSAIVEKGGGSYLANKKRVDDILYELQLENEQLQAGKACLPKKTDEIDMYKRKMIEK